MPDVCVCGVCIMGMSRRSNSVCHYRSMYLCKIFPQLCVEGVGLLGSIELQLSHPIFG